MVAIVGGPSLTRIAGVIAYAAGLAFCTGRWRQIRKRGRGSNLFAALALVQLVLLLDNVFNLRWKLHAVVDWTAASLGVYELRRGPQLLALCGLAALAVVLVWLIVVRFRERMGAALALGGTLLSVVLRCAEVVSYHNADAVLYRQVGGVMVVALAWIGLALVTCLGIWIDARSWQLR
jgi:hypothetical protein